MMSGIEAYPRGKHTPASFILSCLRTVFKEPLIHDRWLPAAQLCSYTHMHCSISDDIQFSQAAMIRVVNKMFPLVSLEPNLIEGEGEVRLQVFQHSFQVKKRSYFFWITTKVGVIPPLTPSPRNSSNWEEDCVLKRLLAGGRAHVLDIDVTVEPEPKQPKVMNTTMTTDKATAIIDASVNATQATISASAVQSGQANSATSWWESGDARKLFRPSSSNYEANECVKEIVMERIELLESVNRKGKSWTRVIETRSWNMETCPYSESDVFTLRFRSMYLALALRQFVLNMSGDLRTQWTWKRCLLFAIEAMNDIGVEYYSNYRTLARWHRKQAKHRRFFCKTPEAKAMIPPFFRDNPDAMEAFKRYGIANIQDLGLN
jgi:hypothetical protein